MKGFDRPIKPEWIYKIIQELEVNDVIKEKQDLLNDILVELDGQIGKRKVITVISRFFLKQIDNPYGRKVEGDFIFNCIKNIKYEEAVPLMFFNLLVKAPILQNFSEQLYKHYYRKDKIDSDFLRKKAYQLIGERDIARRSIRNFLNTMVAFSILEKESRRYYSWKELIKVNDEATVIFLKLYSKYYLNSPQISLLGLPEHLFFYFSLPDLIDLAQKYNNIHWQYMRRVKAAMITLRY